MIKGQRIPDSFKPQEQNIDSKAWHVEVDRHESTYIHSNIHPRHEDDETTTSIGVLVMGAAEKTTPIDADMVPLADTADSNKVRKLSWENIKATLKAYFDGLYAPVGTATFPGFGTSGTTACVGNDTRLSDSRTPVSHSHATSDVTGFAAAALGAAPAETASTIGSLINGSTAAVPNDTDLVATADASVLKKVTWTNVKAFLKTYFDGLYQLLGASTVVTITPPAISLDASGSTVAIANGAYIDFTAFAGLLVLTETIYYGETGTYICGATATTVVAQTGSIYTNTSGAGAVRFFFNGSTGYRLQNNSGNALNFGIYSIRTRASV